MRIKGKLSYMCLLVPVLLFTGVQIFAQAAADSSMPMTGPASHNTTTSHADVFLISDRTFIMKSIEGTMNQSFKSQSAGTVARPISLYESSGVGCSSSIFSLGFAKSAPGGCPVVDCAAPPPGCFYQGPPATGPNGCPTNCGTLVCGPETN